MPKKISQRKKMFYIFGLNILFRLRSSEDERKESSDIDHFFTASIELAKEIITRKINPLDETSSLKMFKYLTTWGKYRYEQEYIVLKFGYLQGLNHIYMVQGNYNHQSKVLRELVHLMADHKDILHISDYHKVRLEVAHAYLEAFTERDLLTKASILETTADSYENKRKNQYPSDRRLSSLILFIKSQSAKYKAFSYINKSTPDLPSCIEKMEEAETYARESTKGSHSSDTLYKHAAYCSYWLNVFRVRNCLLDHDWTNIINYLNSAISSATRFGPSIFPNYFRSSADLANYLHVINAYKALFSDEINECIGFLKGWESISQEIHGDSWFFNSIKMRRLMLEMITAREDKKSSDLLFAQMVNLIKNNFLGRASRNLVSLSRQLLQGELNYADIKDHLFKNFAIDVYLSDGNEDLLVGNLQADCPEITDKIPVPFSIFYSGQNLTPKTTKLDEMLINYLSIVREYRLAKRGLRHEPLNTLPGLLEDFRAGDLIWPESLLTSLIEYINIPCDEVGVKDKLNITRNVIIPETFRKVPHIVRVTKVDRNNLELHRCWNDTSCDCLILHTNEMIHNIYLGRYYYMPPEWNRKRSIRLDLHRGEPIPLLPAEFYENNLSTLAVRYKYYQEFITMLDDASTLEYAFRDLVAENPWMIEPGTATRGKEVHSQPSLGVSSGRIDLLMQLPSDLYRIVEFKRPSISIVKAAADANKQCAKYQMDLIRHHQDKHIDQIMIVVAGRNKDSTPEHREQLSHQYPQVQLLTYDDLRIRIEDFLGLSSGQGLSESHL